MTLRKRPLNAPVHAPVRRGVEGPKWRASTVILLMTVGILILAAIIQIVHD